MATDMTTDRNAIVGRGVAEGARLFRDWFNDLTAVAERGDGAAYCFIAGNMIEIMRTFDIPATFPEINALQTAFRNVSRNYLDEAEDYGYSPDICGYVKTDVAIQLRGGDHPMGRIPKPKLVLLNNYCNTFVKWGEIWERFYDCPVLGIDYPMTRAAGAPVGPAPKTSPMSAITCAVKFKKSSRLASASPVSGSTSTSFDRFSPGPTT